MAAKPKDDRPDRDHLRTWVPALAAHLAWGVCEALRILLCPLGLPSRDLEEEWGCVDQVWCFHVHRRLEIWAWGVERADRAK